MDTQLESQLGKTAADIANDRVFNERLGQSLLESADGRQEKFAAAGDLYIRRFLRERSIVRRLLDFQPATDADLVRLPNEEMPVIWGTLQNASKGAVSLSMKDTADQETFWRDAFVIRFFVISSPEYYKNTFELKGHVQDTVKHLTEDMILDLEEEEDRHWFSASDDVVGTLDGGGQSGYPQHFYVGEFDRGTHIDSQFLFTDKKLPKGINVVNERFMGHFQKLNRTEIGGDLSQELFLRGGEALREGVIGGVTHLFTAKNEYVPDNVMYKYTAADYLGVAREHQKPTLFMEKKKRTLFFSVEEIIAMSIVNTAGVIKCVFDNRPS
ncbi:MAG: hypothetical protein E6R03_03440 [Hyphomicrobiaceae bacterium]|nr:MAG: hypothetical protein E6R03_03440 [Hyphomicrobiaceae bacterium]